MQDILWVLSVFILLWLVAYVWIKKRGETEVVESFVGVPTRKCTVWFTDNTSACNEGWFYKDNRTITYLRNNLLGDMEKQLTDSKNKLASNTVIVNTYKGMSQRAIRDKINAESTAIVTSESAKLTNRNQGLIDVHRGYLNSLDWYASYYFRIVPQMERENTRLRNSITSLKSRIRNVKNSSAFKNIDATLQVKQKNPNFRCKNEYDGWDEFNSTNDPAENDPVKKTSSSTRGDPYTWASCFKLHPNATEKANQKRYIESKRYPDIEYEDRPDPSLTEEQNKRSSQIRFNRFNQDDRTVCDDGIVAPNMPGIPNGLFEVKVNDQDIIQSIRVVKYSNDSRYIDPNQTKNIGQFDGQKLHELFFDSIYEAWPTQQLYIYPKKGADLVYRVHYVYYDNKCQRFFPNTTIPLGVSRGGDMLPKEPGVVVYRNDSLRYLFERSIPNKSVPTRYYINHRNPSGLPIFTSIRNGINAEISNMERIVSQTRDSLNRNINLRNIYFGLYYRTPATILRCRRGGWNWRRARWNTYCWNETNWVKNFYLNIARYYERVVNDLANYINNNLVPILNSLYGRRHAFNMYVNELDATARAFSTNTIQTILQGYVGKPATELIASYNPSYISNNNTLFLNITSFSKATYQVMSLDDAARRISTPEKPLTVYDILDEDTTYENVFTAEEIDPNNFLYVPEESYKMSEELKALLRESYAVFYNNANNPINEFKDLGTFALKESNYPEDPAVHIQIAPGTKVVVRNGSGATQTFENSPEATGSKRVTLNSSMTGGSCSAEEEDIYKCLMTSITISNY
jgi:hypothetical protein